jgi:N-acetylmuramoyl-L-alanine amidase-like protein
VPDHDRDITRRRLLQLGALAAGAQALGPAAAALGATGPRSVSVLVRLPYGRRIGPMHVPGGFELAGLRWPGRAHLHGELRVRRANGRWTSWMPLHSAGDHGPDGGVLGGTDPMWTGPATAFELRLSRPLHGLVLHGVRTSGTRAVSARAAQVPGAPVPIITRSQWGGDSVPPRAPPEYGEVRAAFVHHTVNSNDYQPQDSAGIVLAICRYHRDTNKWNDIGYNFLVDRYGQVFEGRAGGIDQPVVGAQAQGYNSVSTGVANIGTFDVDGQTEPALDAISKLIAWKLRIHGAPVEGEVTVTSNGGDSNRYPSGRQVVLHRVAGHRDGDQTDCPGGALYAQLPDLRNRAAARQREMGGPLPLTNSGGRVTFKAGSAVVTLPAQVDVSGQLVDANGAALGNVPVSLQFQASKGWITVGRLTTAADGTYSGQMPVNRNGSVRAHFGGAQPTNSPPLRVTVVPSVVAKTSSRRIRAGRTMRVSVALAPHRPRVVLALARQAKDGSFVPVGTVRAKVSGRTAAATVRLRRPGLYRIIAEAPADARAASARAPWVLVRAIR